MLLPSRPYINVDQTKTVASVQHLYSVEAFLSQLKDFLQAAAPLIPPWSQPQSLDLPRHRRKTTAADLVPSLWC